MNKNKAQTAYFIVTAINELNRVRDILNRVITETEEGNITISSNALEPEDFYTTVNHGIIRDIRIGLEIRISELERKLEAL